MTVLDEIDDDVQEECETECGCDFVQIIFDQGERFELHHVIPDDGAPHVEDVECGCKPGIERVEYDLIVVDHKDQDLDLPLETEDDPWPPTTTACVTSASGPPGSSSSSPSSAGRPAPGGSGSTAGSSTPSSS